MRGRREGVQEGKGSMGAGRRVGRAGPGYEGVGIGWLGAGVPEGLREDEHVAADVELAPVEEHRVLHVALHLRTRHGQSDRRVRGVGEGQKRREG